MLFNTFSVKAQDNLEDGINIIKQQLVDTYNVVDYSDKRIDTDKPKPVFKGNNKFTTVVILPYMIDKIYSGDKLKEDVTPFLKLVYPEVETEKLRKFGKFLKSLVIVKRVYKKVIAKLEKDNLGKKIFPKDTPIVAKDGEFLSEDAEFLNTSGPDEYKVSNNFYKYLEYDLDELGEPVRLRDKNYIPTPDPDDLMISILKFDMKGIVRAIQNMPYYNDGSAEKAVLSKHNLKARILLDTMNMGDQKNINGVIEVNIPDGYYIKGDYLNDWSLPRFILKEDKDDNLNIGKFQFFMPLAIGVENGNIAKRVFADSVAFPFSVDRIDVKKSLVINGEFSFELCDKDENCEILTTEHRIKLKKSDDSSPSMYYNYVTQSHARIPKEELKFAKISDVVFDKNKKEIAVFFETKRKISNVAVMVEDKKGTNFVNPTYRIDDNRVVATFDVNMLDNVEIDEVAVSASFDDSKTLRKVMNVNEGEFLPSVTYKKYPLWYFYILGLFVNLMPGIFYLYLKLLNLIVYKENRIKIYFRYCFSVLLSLLLYLLIFNNKTIGDIFSNPWVLNLALFIETSILFSLLGYMEFVLFRPLKNIFKYGVFSAVFTVILMVVFPFIGEIFGLYVLGFDDLSYKFQVILASFLGIISLPLIGFYLYKRNKPINLEFNNFNILYGSLYVIFLLYVAFCTQGIIGFCLMILSLFGILFIWYSYPNLLSIISKGKINSKNVETKITKFQQTILMVVVTIYIVSSSVIGILPKAKIENPSIKEINEVILDRNNRGGSTIVAITANWSLLSVYNKFLLHELVKRGIAVAFIDVSLSYKDGLYWFNKANEQKIPLFILFNKRHPNGLVLPSNIKDINFRKTVKFLD